MFDDGVMPGENIGEKQKSEKRGEYAERWEGAMDDAPEFAGEWGYGEGGEEVAQTTNAEMVQSGAEDMGLEEEMQGVDAQIAGASRLTSLGLDTASRVCGLEAVLTAVKETDETGRDAMNPIGAIYERLAPDPELRAYLYQEIKRDRVRENQHNDDAAMEDGAGRVGLTREGDIYDKASVMSEGTRESVEAIQALRRLIETLDTDERFAELREKAQAEGKTPIEYLVKDRVNPTLTNLFNSVGGAMSEGDVEEIVAEAEQANDEIVMNEKNGLEQKGVQDDDGAELDMPVGTDGAGLDMDGDSLAA